MDFLGIFLIPDPRVAVLKMYALRKDCPPDLHKCFEMNYLSSRLERGRMLPKINLDASNACALKDTQCSVAVSVSTFAALWDAAD